MVGELTAAGSPRVLWGSRRSGGRQQRHRVLPDELNSVRLRLALGRLQGVRDDQQRSQHGLSGGGPVKDRNVFFWTV